MESIHTTKLVDSAITFLNHNTTLRDFVRDFDDPAGFAWSDDYRITEIANGLLNDQHSGLSFACTMRKCQSILREQDNLRRTKLCKKA